MLLVEYRLKDFQVYFNSKYRKLETNEDKFKIFKKELGLHLKQFNVDSKVFPDLKIWIENYVLYISYTETTNTTTKIEFHWLIEKYDEKKTISYINDFCDKLQVGLKDSLKVEITDKQTSNAYGLYYPSTKTFLFSSLLIESKKWSFIKKIIKHEVIHHYCLVNNLDPFDTSVDFIKLLIRYDAYISEEKGAQKAYRKYLNSLNVDLINPLVL